MFFFLIDDNLYKYISNTGKSLITYSIAIVEGNFCFLTPHFIFPKREKKNDNDLFSTNINIFDPFDYHVSNCKKTLLKNCV